MGNATYIGRVGALAVALGVGVAVANTPGVAWAEPSDSSPSGSSVESEEPSDPADESPDAPAESDDKPATELDAESADDPDDVDEDDSDDEDSDYGGMKVSAQTISKADNGAPKAVKDDDTGADEDAGGTTVEGPVVAEKSIVDSTLQPSSPPSVAPKQPASQPVSETIAKPRQRIPDTVRIAADAKKAQSPAPAAPAVSENSDVRRFVDAVVESTGQRAATVTTPTIAIGSAVRTAPVEKQVVPAVISEPPTPLKVVSDVVSGVFTAVGLSPVSGDGPATPVESPALMALFAGWRRLSEQGTIDETPVARSQPVLTGQTEDEYGVASVTTAALMSAPAVPTVGSPQSGDWNGQRVVERLYRCR